MSNRRWLLVLVVLLCGAVPSFGQDFLAQGEKELGLNNAAKAVTYLEAALAQGDNSERLLLDLGLAYQRAGQVADAKRTFRQGAELAGPLQKSFWLNLGISNYLSQDAAGAEEAFTRALTADPAYLPALLNRANTRLNAKNWAGAAEDYRAYQAAAPTNPQKEKIDQVLALLDQTVMEAKASQLAEETRKRQEEENKKAAEAAAEADKQKAEAEAAAEKARQDAILAKVRESLAGASDDSKNLLTGPTGAKSDSGDFTLDQ